MIFSSNGRIKRLEWYDWWKKHDQPLKNDKRTYENIQKITVGLEDDCRTGSLLDYLHFSENDW